MFDACIKMPELFVEPKQFLAKEVCQPVFCVFQSLGQTPQQVKPACQHLNAVLKNQTPDLVDLACAPCHDLAAHPMDRLDILLLDFLDRDITHRGALCRFADGLGVRCVVLVGLHEGLEELGRDQPASG